MKKNREIILYSDGAAKGNPGRGGYGAILQWGGHEREFAEGFVHTTNNRMELLGVIVALEGLKRDRMRVSAYVDSTYVVNAVEKKWLQKWLATDFKGKKNSDLWRRFWVVYQRHDVSFHWVRGHAGNLLNERCDRLAVAVAVQGPWGIDEGYMASLLDKKL